jgi:hypothetical protein
VKVTELREGKKPISFKVSGAELRVRGERGGNDERCEGVADRDLGLILGRLRKDNEVLEVAHKISRAPELPEGATMYRSKKATFDVDKGHLTKGVRELLRDEAKAMGKILKTILLVTDEGGGEYGKAARLLAKVSRMFAGMGEMLLISMLVHRVALSKMKGFDEAAAVDRAAGSRIQPAFQEHRIRYLLSTLHKLLEKHCATMRPSPKHFLDAFQAASVYAEAHVGFGLVSPARPGRRELGADASRRGPSEEELVKDIEALALHGGNRLTISRASLESYCEGYGELPKTLTLTSAELSPSVLGSIPPKQVASRRRFHHGYH